MLSNSITNSIQTIMMVGGFIVLFSVVISILKQTHLISFFASILTPVLRIFNIDTSFASSIITGILELTNGVKAVSMVVTKNLSTSLTITAFLLGFGGISIGLQVLTIVSKTDLSIAPYFIGKLLQGIFAAIYTYFIIYTFPIFNLDLQPVSSSFGNTLLLSTTPHLSYITFVLFLLAVIWILKEKCMKRHQAE